jgi:putative glutamine amidotransferase
VIGIATQTLEAIPGKFPPCWVMGQRYVRVLTAANALPWVIPLLPEDESTLRGIYEQLDAVFLTGGVDIDPSHYGEERHELCGDSDPARDQTELTLIRWALADRKPVLGVCRGLQAINVACGGSLYQHVTAQHPEAIKHDYFPAGREHPRDLLAHPIWVEADSRLGRMLCFTRVKVNSMHHQGIKRLAAGLRMSAVAPDGLIEGLETTAGQYLIGVQWHPEELADTHPGMQRLFTDFVAAAIASSSY